MLENYKIAIIGLGYVGLPLAVEFGTKYKTIGFDINTKRVDELNSGIDHTLEVESRYLKKILNNGLFSITSSKADIADANIFIITFSFSFTSGSSFSGSIGSISHAGSGGIVASGAGAGSAVAGSCSLSIL